MGKAKTRATNKYNDKTYYRPIIFIKKEYKPIIEIIKKKYNCSINSILVNGLNNEIKKITGKTLDELLKEFQEQQNTEQDTEAEAESETKTQDKTKNNIIDLNDSLIKRLEKSKNKNN